MFTNSEFERIQNKFMVMQKERRNKISKIWGFFLGLTVLVIIIMIMIFPKQFNSGATVWILPTYGGMVLVTTLTGFLISIMFMSEKPFFDYLYEEMNQKINMDEGLYLEYQSYDKENRGFNKTGGLFTSFASVSIKRHISGSTEEQHKFDIYDCKMVTSSGQSQQTHFDGVYYILEKELNTSIQLRSNGSPKLRKTKFIKQEGYTDFKVFKQQEQNLSNIDYQLIRFYEKLIDNPDYKRVYLGVTDNKIHLALWYKKHPARKQKQLTLETYNRLYSYFLNEYKLITEIDSIEAY